MYSSKTIKRAKGSFFCSSEMYSYFTICVNTIECLFCANFGFLVGE